MSMTEIKEVKNLLNTAIKLRRSAIKGALQNGLDTNRQEHIVRIQATVDALAAAMTHETKLREEMLQRKKEREARAFESDIEGNDDDLESE